MRRWRSSKCQKQIFSTNWSRGLTNLQGQRFQVEKALQQMYLRSAQREKVLEVCIKNNNNNKSFHCLKKQFVTDSPSSLEQNF
jgi:hypothetical protein